MLLKWLSLVYTMAAATTPTSCHASNTSDPTTNIDGTPHDTLEAMVFSCSPSVLLQGRSGTSSTVTSNIILGGAERKRSAMVNVTAAKARAYNEGYNKNGMQEGGGGGGNDDHKEEAVQEVEEVDQDMAMEDDNTNNGCLMYSRRGQKRRLSPEQVRCLERSFEGENKLEGERKLQLAMELHLHPRQVSVWFQNRRARWKTKQLEKDYDALKLSFTTLQAHFDALLHHKQELLREVMFLRTKQHAGPDHGSKATNEELIKAEEKSKEIHGGGHQKLRMPSVDIIIHGEIQEKMSASRVDMKQGDGGGELLKAEVSALSSGSTEGSAVSEAINSPHAIDSGDVDSKENIFDHGAAGAAANIMATVDNQCIISSCAAAASCAAIKTASGDHLSTIISPQIVAFDPIMQQQNAENYSNNSYCSFFLEDEYEGAFPWWSSTL